MRRAKKSWTLPQATNDDQLRVSFIIPVKELNDYVLETVTRLCRLDGDSWEAFVVTNDKESAPWDDARVSIIASGKVGPADKRDLASTFATGEILVFLDDDSYPENDFLSTLRRCFAEGHDVVGGPAITPTGDSFWQQVSGAVYLSRWTGGAPERYAPMGGGRYVLDWPSVNLAIRRETFMDVGGFDCPFWPGEDTFFCDRLSSRDIRIWYCPTLVVLHHRRGSLLQHLYQVGNYGLHRGYFARVFGRSSRRLTYFAPLVLLVCFLLALLAPFQPLKSAALAGLGIYVFAQFVGLVQVAARSRVRYALGAGIYVFPTHLWYAISFFRGFFLTRMLESTLR